MPVFLFSSLFFSLLNYIIRKRNRHLEYNLIMVWGRKYDCDTFFTKYLPVPKDSSCEVISMHNLIQTRSSMFWINDTLKKSELCTAMVIYVARARQCPNNILEGLSLGIHVTCIYSHWLGNHLPTIPDTLPGPQTLNSWCTIRTRRGVTRIRAVPLHGQRQYYW